jgi:predicted small metal-binding protein
MGKMIDCGKVNPASGCGHVVRGETEEEVLKNAKIHAKEHGFSEETPELVAMIKANIVDDKSG